MRSIFLAECLKITARFLISILSAIVFLFFDFLDFFLCIFYRYIDEFFEGNKPSCYCQNREREKSENMETELSETLYMRKNLFREISGFHIKLEDSKKRGNGVVRNRWSDCGCDSCVSWMTDADQNLHVVVREASKANIEDREARIAENIVFLHGFLSSSLFWTETVFPNLSESAKDDYRLFAVDLLGFGRSPKPSACLYTLRDHVEMIEKSVICPFQLNSFHLVAHSMGCVIALALAAKYSNSVKSVTLIAPPYFPSSNPDAGSVALKRLAGRNLWPPILFGSAVMSWYEHLGRCVCFLICRNHRTWEKIIKLFTCRRDLHFMVLDLTRHTHHSAWHTMHNVICGGTKLMDGYLETLNKSGMKICVIQGSWDQLVPLECSNNIKTKVPDVYVKLIANADHNTVILGRENDFIRDLEHIWASTADTRIQVQ